MTNKKRIIELVKQNVISMEEAIQLLEAGAHNGSTANSQTETSNEFIEEYQEAQKEMNAQLNDFVDSKLEEEHEAVAEEKVAYDEAKVLALKDEISKKESALTIATQRLRELEIFAELDELTEEMQEQKANLEIKKAELTSKLEELKAELQTYQSEKFKKIEEGYKKIVDDTTETVTKAAKQFKDEAFKETSKLQEKIRLGLKDLMANFNMKEIGVNVSVPWVKKTEKTHQYIFPVNDDSVLEVQLLSGSIDVKTADVENVTVDLNIEFLGKEENATIEAFEQKNTIDGSLDRIFLDISHPSTVADLVLTVPANKIPKCSFKTLNGDIKIEGISAKEMIVDSKNGDSELKEVQAEFIELSGINGDFEIKDCQIQSVDFHTINGDLVYRGHVGDLTSDVITGDILITKTNHEESNLSVKTVSGDIKIAIPKAMNVDLKYDKSFGDFHSRMSGLIQVKDTRFERHLNEQVAFAKIDVKTSSGDIYLKDQGE